MTVLSEKLRQEGVKPSWKAMSTRADCDAASSVQLTCWTSAFATFDHVPACILLQNLSIVRTNLHANVGNVARADRATASRRADDHIPGDPADHCAA